MMQHVEYIAELRRSLDILENPVSEGKSYDRLIFISHPRHLESFEPTDNSILVVALDWTTRQIALEQGFPTISFEEGLTHPPVAEPGSVFIRCADWMYIDSKDVTEYLGVSLGRKFSREISLVMLEIEKIDRCCRGLLKRFKPLELIFYDIRSDQTVLLPNQRAEILMNTLRKQGVRYRNHMDPPDSDDDFVHETAHYGIAEGRASAPQIIKAALKTIFTASLEMFSSLISLIDQRPCFLAVLTQMNSRSLLDPIEKRRIVPCLFSDLMPSIKNPKFVLLNFFWGFRLTVPLSKQARNIQTEQAKIFVHSVSDALTKSHAVHPVLHEYIQAHLIHSGRLEELANWVEGMLQNFKKLNPQLIYLDSLQNKFAISLAEIAREKGIPVLFNFHGQYIHDEWFDVLGGDKRIPSSMTKILTWGKAMDSWAHVNAPDIPSIRVGRDLTELKQIKTRPWQPPQKILVLQYAVPNLDTDWPQEGQFKFFVSMVKKLNTVGYKNIKMKLHPGPTKSRYFQNLATRYDLKCSIHKRGNFSDYLDWCDVVIGPAASGAMVEAALAGRPYFPVVLKPTCTNYHYLSGIDLFHSEEKIVLALQKNLLPDPAQILAVFADAEAPTNKLIWTAISEAVNVPQNI